MHRKQFLYPFLFILLILALAACAAPPTMPPETPASSSPASTEKTTPTSTPTPVPTPTNTPVAESIMPQSNLSPDMQKVAEQATEILAKSLNVAPEAITILSVQRVQWRNASLGCPKPGMMYAQVITPGYLVKAEIDGQVREVHMNDRGHGVVCPPARAQKPFQGDDVSQ